MSNAFLRKQIKFMFKQEHGTVSRPLTHEGKRRGQREKHAVTVHGEGDGKVHEQAAQNEEGVHRRPVGHLQPQLREETEETAAYIQRLTRAEDKMILKQTWMLTANSRHVWVRRAKDW